MEDTSNAYLQLRAAKIARNQARLMELGLFRPPPTSTARPPQLKKTQNSAKRKSSAPLRRSSRHSERPATYLELLPAEPKRSKRRSDEARGNDSKAATVTLETETKTFHAHSARAMNIHVGNLVSEGLLGSMMEQTGKAFVMEEAAQRSGIDVGNISFNKYSGVQEWKNDALFLWVNLGNGGDVVNDFLNDGRQITWFGGSRMHDETKVIRRLLRVGRAVGNGQNVSSDGLVLWCRRYNADQKGFTPYVCLGRLSYHSHEPGSRPLKFVWNLVDYDGLVNHEDETVRSTFQEFLKS